MKDIDDIGIGFVPGVAELNPAIQFQTGEAIYFAVCLPLNWNIHLVNLKRLTR